MENPDRWVQKKTLGLALGGGGSRAICHLGVLKALEDAGIRVDYISGNSMGGVIGAAYSVGNGVDDAREKVCGAFCGGGLIKPRKGDGLERAPGFFQHMKRNLRALCISLVLSFRRGFMRKNSCAKAVPGILEDISFEDLKIPFGVVALNLTDGKLDFITSGPLRDPVIAGTSIGIVFAPYEVNGKEYIDAAPVCSVPAPQARGMGADVVLAVDIRNPIPENYKVLNGFDTIFRLEMVQSNLINQAQAETADILLQPPVEPMFWGDFSHNDEVIEVGRTAMQEQIDALKQLLG